MMARRFTALAATAYHEAGHAVATFLINPAWFRGASIMPEDGSLGRVRHSNPIGRIRLDLEKGDRARLRVERAIQICLAGPAAQKRAFPRSVRKWQATSDYSTAADLAIRICGSAESASAFLIWQEVVTNDMISGRWKHIERVASALIQHQELDLAALRLAILGPPISIRLVETDVEPSL
jgi:ATP-dependent Zn protease